MVIREVRCGATVLTFSPLPVCASIIKCSECAEENHEVAPVEEEQSVGLICKQSVSLVLDTTLFYVVLSVRCGDKKSGC